MPGRHLTDCQVRRSVDIHEMVDHLQTGFLPALHHLANLEFIDAAAHERLKNDVPDGIKK